MSGTQPQDDFSGFTELFDDPQPQSTPDPADPAAIAARRRRRIRRRITGGVVVLVILAAVGSYVPLTLLAPASAAAVETQPPVVAPPAKATFAVPVVGESAVTVAGADGFPGASGTNGILIANGGNGARPIASISKLVTALVVLDARPLGATDAGPTLTFSKADSDLYDKYYVLNATVQPMKAGSAMSERDALQVMLLPSASNYAEAVSTWAFGSQAKYLHATSVWLAAHRLTGTKIVEPTGVSTRNVSTPTDLLALGKLAMANPLVASIVKSSSAAVANIGGIANTNDLLGTEGVNGIKTGTLDGAGSDLLFSASLDVGADAPLSVIGVVLGGDSRETVDADVRNLLASIRTGFHKVPLVAQGQRLGDYSTPWKDDASVVAGEDASVLTWSDTPITSTVVTRPLNTAKTGSKVGTVTFAAGTRTVTVPLVLKGSIRAPDAWWRLTHPAEVLGW
jgi:D-alanyl-D-alanine carboxypeptidase (penicillin-binding protein 5/6)